MGVSKKTEKREDGENPPSVHSDCNRINTGRAVVAVKEFAAVLITDSEKPYWFVT